MSDIVVTDKGFKTYTGGDRGVEDYAKMSSEDLLELFRQTKEVVKHNAQMMLDNTGTPGFMDSHKEAYDQISDIMAVEQKEIIEAAQKMGMDWVRPPEEKPDPLKMAGIKPEDADGMTPDKLHDALQKFEIEKMKGINPDEAEKMQLVHDNPNKTIYLDTRNGAEVTVIDGDKETIKPLLAHKYEMALKGAGGDVEALIEKRTAEMKEAGVPQAIADKQVELMREAGNDSQKYAELRFESNDFFRQQAKAAGQNPELANDSISSVVQKVKVEVVELDDKGQPIEKEQDPKPEPEKLAFDEKSLVPLHENGKLTNLGGALTGFKLMNGLLPPDKRIDNETVIDVSNKFFKEGLERFKDAENPLQAFAEDVKKNGVPVVEGMPGSGINPKDNAKECQEMADAILKSEGKPEYFTAELHKNANKINLEELAQKNARDALLANQQEQEASADAEKDGAGVDFGNLDLKEILNMLVSIFKGNMSFDQAIAQITKNFDKEGEGADKDKKADKEGEEPKTEAERVAENKGMWKPEEGEAHKKVFYEGKDGVTCTTIVGADGEPQIVPVDPEYLKEVGYTKKEVVADNKDEKPAKETEGQYFHCEQTKSTAGAPTVNKNGDCDNYIALKTEDGGQKSLKEGFNDTANDPPTNSFSASFSAIKAQFGFLSSNEAEQKQPEQHNDDNSVGMGGGMMGGGC